MSAGAQKTIVAFYLLALGFGAVLLAESAWDSVTSYSSAYAIRVSLPRGEPLTDRLVLVVLDGVGVEASRRMPTLQSLAERGSSGIALVTLPSLSNPGRATLATGALPEAHGVTNNGRFRPPPVDSIFSLAQKAGVPAAVFGGGFWPRAFGDYLGDKVHVFRKELGPSPDADHLVEWQAKTCREMAPFLADQAHGLLVAGITATDEAGHDFGGESEEFFRLVAEADRCLAGLLEALDDGETTFIVTADHGHIQRRGRGGHGGSEPEVRRVPLVLAGRAIAAERGWAAGHLDVAPTIAALLGLPLPANARGGILFDVLALNDEQKHALTRRQDEQRRLHNEKIPDRAASMARERRSRAPAGLTAALWFLTTLFLAPRGASRARLAAAILAYFVCYFALFWVLGLGYSLSVTVREEYLNAFFAKNTAAAAASIVAAGMAYRGHVLRVGVAVAALVGLRLAWVWYDSGLVMRAHMPDLDQAFMAYLDLLQIFALALTACLWAASSALKSRRRASTKP